MTSTRRLWPLLVVLAALISGAVTLDVYASRRSVAPLVVTVTGQSLAVATADGVDDDEPAGTDAEESAAVSPEHTTARDLGRRGDLEGAIDTFRRVAEAHPESADVAAELGYWLLRARRVGDATDVLTQALARHPDDGHVALNLGVALRRAGDLPGAEKVLRRAVDQRPQYHSARVALATVLCRRGKASEAVEVLRKGVGAGGNRARAAVLVALGSALLEAKRGDEADRAMREAVQWAPAEPTIRIAAAKAYLRSPRKEDRTNGLQLASEAADLAPDVAAVHVVLARAREKVGDRSGAEEAYARALRLEPTYAYARRRLVRLALDRDDVHTAETLAARLVSDYPADPEHHFLAGAVAAAADRLDDARVHYAAAVEKAAGTYPEAFFNLGLLEKRAGQLDAAVIAYERALEQRPGYPAAWNNLGLVHMARDDSAAARKAFEHALQVDPRYGAARLNLARVESGDGHFDRAIELLERAIEDRPRYRQALLNLGVAYRKAGRTDEAIATYRSLTTTYPRYVLAWSNMGFALAAAKKPTEAMAAYRRALELDPEHVSTLRVLASLEQEQGLLGEAQQTYQALLDQEPDDVDARLSLAEVLRRRSDAPACAAEAKRVLTAEPSSDPAKKLLRLCEGETSGG